MELKDYLKFIGNKYEVTIERPIGFEHSKDGVDFKYSVNYGYIKGITADDGEDIDVYIVGPTIPYDIGSTIECLIIGISYRVDDNENKLIGVPSWYCKELNEEFSADYLIKAVHFREKYYDSYIIFPIDQNKKGI
jgi:inorganic pyrophosphatase